MSIRSFLLIAISFGVITQLPLTHSVLIWQREAIANGEVWRILTGNFTHTNWPHLAMNILALCAITSIYRKHIQLASYCVLICLLSLVVGLSIFLTDIDWYAGLSGVLHGLFAWGAIRDIKAKVRSGWLLLGGVICKVGWELWFGGSSSTEALIGARVAVEAHLVGGVTGALVAVLGKNGPRVLRS